MRKITLAVVVLISGLSRVALSSSQLSFLVFPPENLTNNTALSWVGEGICLAVTDQIRIPGVEAFGRQERLNFVEGADLPPNATLSRGSMIRIAQLVSADRLIMGSYSGSDESLCVRIRVLDVKSLKLSDEIVSTGSLESLPGMENDLAWALLSGSGLNAIYSRDKFRERIREIPNAAYAAFIQSLASADQDEQIRLLEKAVELHPVFPEAQYCLGRYYHEHGDCTAAIRHLSVVGPRRPSFPEDQFIIGNCYMNLNDSDNAIRCYTAVSGLIQSAHALNNAGVAHTIKGDFALAESSLEAAIALSQADPAINLNLAVARHLHGDEGGAKALLDGLERSAANRGLIQYLLGRVLSGLGEAEQSARVLDQAKELGIDPEKMNSVGPRGWMYLFPYLESRP